MKIVHISDIHIRNLKYHKEYINVFENLYRKLDEIKPDIVVNTGDTAHTKLQISPEFVEMTSNHIKNISQYAPLHMILGNHDMNLINLDRQDAISPIINNMNNDNVFLHKKSGFYKLNDDFSFCIFSCADEKNYPTYEEILKHNNTINIGLFHGSVLSVVTDTNWELKDTDIELSMFDGLDYVLLGDIHKQQFMDCEKKIWYAGSLVQQNFGEEVNKGFLLWDIESKSKHSVKSYFLSGSRKFFTIKLNDNLSIPDEDIEKNSRIRIIFPKPVTLVRQKEIKKKIREKYSPLDIISVQNSSITNQSITSKTTIVENLRDISVQEKLIKNYLSNMNLSDNVMKIVFELNSRYQVLLEKNEDVTRNVTWKINKVGWNNMFKYGENNLINFNSLTKGVVGLFAPNYSGKSTLIDIIAEGLYDKTTHNITKNIHLINDNKEKASIVIDLSVNENDYMINRNIERIKYGKKKDNIKEWAKTTIEFYKVDKHGNIEEKLNGILRPETERNIRKKVGTFDDFALTSLSSQDRTWDLIRCKETERKKILFKFLDLDIFEKKYNFAKDESRQYFDKLNEFENNDISIHYESYKNKIFTLKDELKSLESDKAKQENKYVKIHNKIMLLNIKKITINNIVDIDKANENIKILNEKKEKYKESISSIHNNIININNKLKLIKHDVSKIDSKFYLKIINEINELSLKLNNLKTLRSEFKRLLLADYKNASLLNEVPCGNSYPKCKFLIEAFCSKENFVELKKKIIKLDDKILYVEGNLKKLHNKNPKTHITLYNKLKNDIELLLIEKKEYEHNNEKINLQISIIDKDIKSLRLDVENCKKVKSDINKNLKLDLEISKLDNDLKKLNEIISKAEDTVSKKNREMGAAQSILDSLEKEVSQLKNLKTSCSAYECYMNAMNKDGIAHQILAEKLPLINDEIGKILSDVVDFNVFLEHNVEEQSIRLYIQYGEFRSRVLELGSGAEKMLSSLAIRAALLNISNLPKTNIFIIDEGFGKLDNKNSESMQKMLDYLKSSFEHIIVISHVEALKDMVDDVIEISSDKEGYAHIEIN